MIRYFIVHAFLTIVVFFIYISKSNFSGGEIGMTPIAVIITILIQFTIGVVFNFIVNKIIPWLNNYIRIIIYVLLFEVCFFAFTGELSLYHSIKYGFERIYLGYTVSPLIAGFFVIVIMMLVNYLGLKKK